MSSTITSEAKLIASRKRRSTGTTVEILDNRAAGDDERPWLTRCADHDTTAAFKSQEAARKAARKPEGWCGKCRAAQRRAERAAA